MYELIDLLQAYQIAPLLIVLAVVLVMIDYYFPVDTPAHLGYFCFGAGMFFLVPLSVTASLLLGLGCWVLLAVLHQVWFTRFLTNAPSVQRTANKEDSDIRDSSSVAEPE